MILVGFNPDQDEETQTLDQECLSNHLDPRECTRLSGIRTHQVRMCRSLLSGLSDVGSVQSITLLPVCDGVSLFPPREAVRPQRQLPGGDPTRRVSDNNHGVLLRSGQRNPVVSVLSFRVGLLQMSAGSAEPGMLP